MALATTQSNQVTVDDIMTWTRQRDDNEIHGLLGRRMAAIAMDSADADDDEEAGLYDLMTV